MPGVDFKNVVKRYDAEEVVHGVNLSIADGEFVVLVGPSGCGKSTCLRMLAGLEDITGGEILIDGRVVNEVEPRNRDIAMVFQDYALYPHMSVYDNIAFSLLYRKVPKREIRQRVTQAAEILDLTPLLSRRPKQLSGGQRQRVAMGRAIVRQPQVFLFDEPLSNLDAKLRGTMRLEIKKLHRQLGVTTVYVTHDQIEAMTLADRVVVMNGGNIDQIGTPEDVYHRPATLFVAGFIGSPTMNLLNARRADDGSFVLGDGTVRVTLDLATDDMPENLIFGVRPEHVSVFGGKQQEGHGQIDGVVDVVEALGPDTLVFSIVAGHTVAARVRPDVKPRAGEPVRLSINLERSHLFNTSTGEVVR
jgi:multiple sugar transport system ATP-binding protein